MKQYIIELTAEKIFSRVSEAGAPSRLLRPHGDEFFTAETHEAFADYWAWFEEEVSGECKIFFRCAEKQHGALERLKNAAPAELKKFFTAIREELPPVKAEPKSAQLQVSTQLLTSGQLRVSAQLQTTEPLRSPKPSRASEQSRASEPLRVSAKSGDGVREKISAQDLREYIDEQSGEHG